MPVIQRLLRALKASTLQISWTFLLLVVLAHMGTTWILFNWVGEAMAESLTDWIYFYVVVSSTVGFGDFSPTTDIGKWIATFYLIPGGISLFAALIGKATVTISTFWRLQMQGKGDFSHLSGHTLVIGWHGETTERILDILKADNSLPDEIVLCVIKEMSNPRPADLKFVKGESFSNAELLKRAGVESASRIIIYDTSDDRVATVALSAYSLKSKEAHIVAHCANPDTAAMLRRTLPGIECTQALALEMLVRSASDAGISRVVNELLAVDRGATQYQTKLRTPPEGATFGDLFIRAKNACNATVLGLASGGNDSDDSMLNPANDRPLKDGDVVYYMANTRISEQQLSQLLTDAS
ncbi:ion channel [Vreelandella sulfidaeris]|uniref:ion channel n=1 Tax=Vreelandella sulfidaeris TaxID=115553 RepID=UPI0035F04C2D